MLFTGIIICLFILPDIQSSHIDNRSPKYMCKDHPCTKYASPSFSTENRARLQFIQAQSSSSRAITDAIHRILEDAFSKATSTMFVIEKSTLNHSTGLRPRDVLSDVLRTVQTGQSLSFFVANRIENVYSNERRHSNMFIIDEYTSFRYIK